MKKNALEGAIQKDIIKYIRGKWILCERINSGIMKIGRSYVHLATNGHPDIVCYLGGGRTLFLEIKSATGKVTPDQEQYHARLWLLGHQVEVVRDIKHVENLLADLGF